MSLPKSSEAPPRLNLPAIILTAALCWAIVIAIGLLLVAPVLSHAIRYVLGSV